MAGGLCPGCIQLDFRGLLHIPISAFISCLRLVHVGALWALGHFYLVGVRISEVTNLACMRLWALQEVEGTVVVMEEVRYGCQVCSEIVVT